VRCFAFQRDVIKGISPVVPLYVLPWWLVFDPFRLCRIESIRLRKFRDELRSRVGDRHVFISAQFGDNDNKLCLVLVDAQPAMGSNLLKQLIMLEGVGEERGLLVNVASCLRLDSSKALW
jgi:hypothetical protein